MFKIPLRIVCVLFNPICSLIFLMIKDCSDIEAVLQANELSLTEGR